MKESIFKEQFIKSSDLVFLFNKVLSYYIFNSLNQKIIFNHMYNEDNFYIIHNYIKKLSKRRLVTGSELQIYKISIYKELSSN